MKITIIVEGATEKAFRQHLLVFLESRLAGKMPNIDFYPYDGRIPKERDLRRAVERLLDGGVRSSDAVIGLTDVYTGAHEFLNADDAKRKMQEWVGNNGRFYPHVAKYEFEAWLLPYWDTIQRIAGHNRAAPAGAPEDVDHNKPPSHHIREIFRVGGCREHYSKVRDANRILRGKYLGIAASTCPEMKSFLNRILTLSNGTVI